MSKIRFPFFGKTRAIERRIEEFLDAVSDGFIQATLVRGRPGTAMRSWARGGFGFGELSPKDINDIVAYIRSWQDDG